MIVDPHKWLFAPFDCAALLYRVPRLAKAVHSQDAAYLDIFHHPGAVARDTDGGPWNPSDYAIHLTRRARGLPLWFSLAVHGVHAYRDAVETVLETTRRCAELIEDTRTSPSCVCRALGLALPSGRFGPGRLRTVVEPAAGRPDRLRHAHLLGG